MRFRIQFLLWNELLIIILLASCASLREPIGQPIRNPLVVIHGIMGAKLEVDGKAVWGAYRLNSVEPNTPEGAKITALPLQVPQGELCERQPEVKAEGLRNYDVRIGWVHSFGGLYLYATEPIYNSLYVFLEDLGYHTDVPESSTPGRGLRFNLEFQLPGGKQAVDRNSSVSFVYDWRRDNIENACLLSRFLKETRAEIEVSTHKEIAWLRARGKKGDFVFATQLEEWLKTSFRFDIIAHSMGGLVARYFLRYGEQDIKPGGQLPALNWAGEKEIDKLILLGTPNLGAPQAMTQLIEGLTIPGLDKIRYHPAIIGSMPSLYQLLPRSQHKWIVDPKGDEVPLYDVDSWERNQWGLLATEDDPIMRTVLKDKGRAGAKEYLHWCLERAKRFHEALDQQGEPATTKIFLISGMLVPTLSQARGHWGVDGKLTFDWSKQLKFLSGDGIVPLDSAIAFGSDPTILAQPDRTWIIPSGHLNLVGHESTKTILRAILEVPSN